MNADHEQDITSGSEQGHSDEPEPAEPANDQTPEDLTETSGQRQDPVSNTGIDPTLTTPDLGDDDPDDNPIDLDATHEDLEGGDLASVQSSEPPASDLVITISDHKIEVEQENVPTVESITSVNEMSADDLQRMQRVISEASARRGVLQSRPFKFTDLDTLQLLYQQIRAELGSR